MTRSTQPPNPASATRHIVLDVETTGLDPADNHYIVELAALELINLVPTDSYFHGYFNPNRPEIPAEVVRIHGLTKEFLSDKPSFPDKVDEFLDFIADSPLIIHNAEFDMKFVNAELQRSHRETLPLSRAVCTLIMAQKKFPGARNSLDKLCERFSIDRSSRTLHGAKIDVELLAKVYLALMGGRQIGMSLDTNSKQNAVASVKIERKFRAARPHLALPEELEMHKASLALLKSPIWSAS